MAQLTPQGYKLKPQNQWFAEERALYLEIDPQWNLDPSTPDGLKMAHDAEIFSALDEALQQAYNSKDPNKAVGVDLDIICAITGTRRSEGTFSGVELLFTGTPGALVLSGAIVESETDGTRWVIPQTYTIQPSGTALVPARHERTGPVQAEPLTLTRIITTMTGITAVTNPDPATPGTNVENNSSLRIKRNLAVGRPGKNQTGSTLGELFAVPGVRRARIYENFTGSAAVDPVFNPHGLPAHSTAVLVDGGEDADIAFALYSKRNPGPEQAAVTSTVIDTIVTDPDYPTNRQPMRFNRPEYVDMVIALELVDPDGVLPENIEDLIRDAFIEFAGGELTNPSCGFRNQGFDIGESVPYSSLFTPVNKVIGPLVSPYVSTLLVNGVSSNQTIAYNELSRWTPANITVTIAP